MRSTVRRKVVASKAVTDKVETNKAATDVAVILKNKDQRETVQPPKKPLRKRRRYVKRKKRTSGTVYRMHSRSTG